MPLFQVRHTSRFWLVREFVLAAAFKVADAVVNRGRGCGWRDYDNDGFLDLFVTNGEDGTQFVLERACAAPAMTAMLDIFRNAYSLGLTDAREFENVRVCIRWFRLSQSASPSCRMEIRELESVRAA